MEVWSLQVVVAHLVPVVPISFQCTRGWNGERSATCGVESMIAIWASSNWRVKVLVRNSWWNRSLLKQGNLFGVRSLNDHGLERPQAGPQKPSYKSIGAKVNLFRAEKKKTNENPCIFGHSLAHMLHGIFQYLPTFHHQIPSPFPKTPQNDHF